MQKNLYEILEIDKKASSEIIEKAYKTLVKKYHPDLQDDILKHTYENKLKEINDAYDILSIPEKRKKYDQYLSSINIQNKTLIENLQNENTLLKNKLNELSNINYQHSQSNTLNNLNNNNLNYEQQAIFEKELNKAKQKAYNDTYIKDLKARGYKIGYKKTFKQTLKDIITILLTLSILIILFKIPFIRHYIFKLS